jgi:hypothetical protein
LDHKLSDPEKLDDLNNIFGFIVGPSWGDKLWLDEL